MEAQRLEQQPPVCPTTSTCMLMRVRLNNYLSPDSRRSLQTIRTHHRPILLEIHLENLTGPDRIGPLENATGSKHFSVSAWVKPTSLTGSTGYLCFADYADFVRLEIYPTGTGGATFKFNLGYSPTLTISNTTKTISANSIYYVVGTYDGTTGNLYVNGALWASSTAATNVDPGGNAMAALIGIVLGNHSNYGDPYSGYLQDVAFYNKTLSAQQISQIYNAGI